MIVELYRSVMPGRKMLHALFAKEADWREGRGGHQATDWIAVGEVDLGNPGVEPDFEVAEACRAIANEGVFLFQRPIPPTLLDIEEDRLLREFRLKVTIPLLRDSGVPCLEVLGTGTLLTRENRYFVVTADHIFREKVDDAASALIALSDVAVPDRPRNGRLHTLGSLHVYRPLRRSPWMPSSWRS